MADMMMNRRAFVGGSLAASALAALAGCGKKTDGGTTTGGTATDSANVLKFYINNPVAIDPYNTQESEGTQVEHVMFDALTDYDWNTNEIVPKAAEYWDVNDDATEFTFHLVEGATFHNGDPVDAASFKRGWERICDPNMTTPSEIRYHLDPDKGALEMAEGKATELTGVEAVDDYTLKVTLTAPMADFPYICAHPALVPVPQAALDDPEKFLVAPIDNGPFMIDGEWVADQYINLVRYDNYYGTPAAIDGIYFSIQKDPDTAFREFEAGNIDFTSIPSGRMSEISEKYGLSDDGYTVTPGAQVLTGAEASIYYLCVNCEDEVMKDPVIRNAISLAINRQNIIDTVFEGTRVPADCIFPKVIDDDPSNAWENSHYDLEAAAKMLDEKYPAGSDGKRGIKIKLSYNSGGGHEDIMSIIQGDLEKIGIEVQQESLEWAAYLDALGDGNYQIGRLGWIADYPTMDNFLYPNVLSTSENNYSKYVNAEVDKAMNDARQIVDDEERKAAYRKINQMVGADMPIIPVMFYSHNHVGSERLASFFYDAQGKAEFAVAELV
ncbi:MAG: ABC transporter substrate-binding protein [Atopobiaceae bacterium]|nr:ABC transporter substrate-binding protein [Atopobiaceae bacterium]